MAFFLLEKREKFIQQIRLQEIEVVENFEYKKNNDSYWNKVKLYKQVINKTLPIIKAFYPKYSLFFLFDNVTIHLIYTKDIF